MQRNGHVHMAAFGSQFCIKTPLRLSNICGHLTLHQVRSEALAITDAAQNTSFRGFPREMRGAPPWNQDFTKTKRRGTTVVYNVNTIHLPPMASGQSILNAGHIERMFIASANRAKNLGAYARRTTHIGYHRNKRNTSHTRVMEKHTLVGEMCPFCCPGVEAIPGVGDEVASREIPLCIPPGDVRRDEEPPEEEDKSFSGRNPSRFDGCDSALAWPALASALLELLALCRSPTRGVSSPWLDERRRVGLRPKIEPSWEDRRVWPPAIARCRLPGDERGQGQRCARQGQTVEYDKDGRQKAYRRRRGLGSQVPFTVLAIESSADDTCAAVVTSDRQILSNVVVRQDSFHESYGGIHPYIAIEAHQQNMPGAVQKALQVAGMSATDVDGIAFTRGPGIGGCLSVGSNAAKTLAAALNKPLVGVHHMQAHALTPFLTTPANSLPTYPFLTLLVSGGHTLLLLATSPRAFRVLATTLDESIGRAFDKVSRMLALPWSAHGPGAALEQFCRDGPAGGMGAPGGEEIGSGEPAEAPHIPLPMRGRLAFSYTGLHSSVERFLHARGGVVDARTKHAIATTFQKNAVGQLEEKLALGLQLCRRKGIQIRHVVVSGGVASNSYLRERLRICLDEASPDEHIALIFPPPSLCTDNAVMIAWASMHRFLAGDTDDYTVELRRKWSIEELDPSAPAILDE
ncbi:hypothetical protein IEO21_05423 [Rhodonia placenta]|uniref:N(6)-L-threonylcarbamoyladenine synthase n=1 Tax=Rhodonia placenta TaxID=104341 RepID=A0A8H7U2B9_9APHY|nr:hypothetical protein IEO21_05423 [Postia placenta]